MYENSRKNNRFENFIRKIFYISINLFNELKLIFINQNILYFNTML